MWDCETGVACECSGLDKCNTPQCELSRAGLNGIGNMSLTDVLRLWYTNVNEYSKLKLRLSNERLPALSGPAGWISRRISRLTNDGQYLAGLWRHNLARGLLWQVGLHEHHYDGFTPTGIYRRHTYQAPTWSWASHPGPISYAPNVIRELVQRTDFKVLATCREIEGAKVFGKVSSSHIICRGALLSVRIRIKCQRYSEVFFQIEELGCSLANDINTAAVFSPDVDFHPHEPDCLNRKKTLYALLVASSESKIHGLVLEQLDTTSDNYTRLSHFETSTLSLFELLDSHPTQLRDRVKTIKIL